MHTLPYALSAAVIAVLAWYYFIQQGFPVNLNFTNAVVAFSATVVLALAFLAGPVGRIRRLKRALLYRKDFGLVGYALASVHVLLSAWLVMDREAPIAYSDASSLVFAGVAFMVFTLMAITSTRSWVRHLGYANWKNLQRTGYVALAFVAIHIVLLQQGVFLERTVGQWTLSLVLFVFLARAVVLVLDVRRQQLRRRRTRARRVEERGAPTERATA